ncbi:hypothetical protein GCM10023322_69170 [Rugosimonospora acidiphila]|uniref:BioF2-like acetyltransferase domain-containing protein n=1 Tax=Rugosimonospora acidiphila TaxID=556531 RepID=A0ABP9SMA4_9ACTN
MRFEIYNARVPRDRERWQAVHDAWPTREVFAHPAYVGLFAGEGQEALAAFAETDSGPVLYPFVLRPVDAPHLAAGLTRQRPIDRDASFLGPASGPTSGREGPPAFDVTSAYGYAGAFCQAPLDEPDAKQFWVAFDEFCRDRRVVSEFTRLSLLDDQRLAHPGRVEPRLTNVVCDLRMPEDAQWRGFDHKVRKNVNKARRAGVTVEVDEVGARLDDFLRVYAGTMDRRSAADGFYFPRAFFETIVAGMPGRFAFFHALHAGRVVSTELVLVSADTLYSYLGGTDRDAFDLRPNDLLKFEVCRWGRAAGASRFVLGGGYAPDDGIFRYKRAFAPTGLVPYSVGTRVLDEPGYARLLGAHHAEGLRRDPGWRPGPAFFPGYRCPLPDPVSPENAQGA